MKYDDAITLAGDCHVDKDPDDGVLCLYIHGRGIALDGDKEVEIAEEIIAAFAAIHAAHNVKLTGAREDACKDQTTPAGRPG